MDKLNILIGADVVPTKSNHQKFSCGDPSQLLDEEILSIWNSADFRIYNLEAPLYDGNSPINKCGPNLKISTLCFPGIKGLNPDLILLANNHILDHGEKGLDSTIQLLSENSLEHIGVGKQRNSIKKYYEFEQNFIRVAVYNCTEHEFSIATEDSAGANPFDSLESFDDVAFLKSRNDIVIVCYHGGKEYYRYPSPDMRRIFRKFAEKGANAVIAQHTHCIGCCETYKNSTLIYGQGNFIFDIANNSAQDSILCKLICSKENCVVEYIPTHLENGKCCRTKHNESLNEFFARSKKILEKGFVENKYKEFAKTFRPYYLRQLKGNGIFIKILSKFLPAFFIRYFCRKKNLLAIQNFIESEAHRELLIESLKEQD